MARTSIAPKWIGVGVGAVAGVLVGVLLGVTVFGDDEPRLNLVAVTLPATSTTSTAPTTTMVDAPLAAAPGETSATPTASSDPKRPRPWLRSNGASNYEPTEWSTLSRSVHCATARPSTSA